MKIKFLIPIFLFIIFTCNAEFSLLVKEVSKESLKVVYNKSVEENISIHSPDIDNELFSKLLQKLILKDKKENFCDNKGKVLIFYEVKHLTSNLLSILKKVDIQFCPHYSEIHYEEEVNYLIKDNKLVSFGLSDTSKAELRKALINQDECNYYAEEVSFDFYIEQGKSFLQIWQSKICNYTIEIQLKKELLSFE